MNGRIPSIVMNFLVSVIIYNPGNRRRKCLGSTDHLPVITADIIPKQDMEGGKLVFAANKVIALSAQLSLLK